MDGTYNDSRILCQRHIMGDSESHTVRYLHNKKCVLCVALEELSVRSNPAPPITAEKRTSGGTYIGPKACKRGHEPCTRYTKNKMCVACSREDAAKNARDKQGAAAYDAANSKKVIAELREEVKELKELNADLEQVIAIRET